MLCLALSFGAYNMCLLGYNSYLLYAWYIWQTLSSVNWSVMQIGGHLLMMNHVRILLKCMSVDIAFMVTTLAKNTDAIHWYSLVLVFHSELKWAVAFIVLWSAACYLFSALCFLCVGAVFSSRWWFQYFHYWFICLFNFLGHR